MRSTIVYSSVNSGSVRLKFSFTLIEI